MLDGSLLKRIPLAYWTRLPFARHEMHGSLIDIDCTDSAKVMRGTLAAHSHENAERGYAVLVSILDGTDSMDRGATQHYFLDPLHVAALGRCQLPQGGFHYYLPLPQSVLHSSLLNGQLKPEARGQTILEE